MTYKVEVATEANRKWVEEVAAVRMLAEELQRPELIYPARIRELVDKGISDGLCLVCEKDGEPVGVIGAFIVENLFNPNYKIASEIFWYVLPNYRKTRAGLMLLNSFIDKASQVADEATLSILIESSEINIETLEKKGFKLNEFAFRKEF